MLRQPSDTQLQRINTLKLTECMHRQNIRESGSEAAIDNSCNVCVHREGSFGQLLFDDAVVMSKIAEMTAGFNGSFAKKVIEMERYRADNDAMRRHQLDNFPEVTNIYFMRMNSLRIESF